MWRMVEERLSHRPYTVNKIKSGCHAVSGSETKFIVRGMWLTRVSFYWFSLSSALSLSNFATKRTNCLICMPLLKTHQWVNIFDHYSLTTPTQCYPSFLSLKLYPSQKYKGLTECVSSIEKIKIMYY
jgi:hypothetical protein